MGEFSQINFKNKEIAMTYEPDMIFGWWDDFNPHLLNGIEDWNANPDVIIVPFLSSQNAEEMANKILNDPALANVNAVKNKRVHPIVRAEIYGSCPRTVDGFENFAKYIYPDVFN